MIVNSDIDIKQYYRFIEFVSKLSGINLPHERFKLIALDNYKAESKNEFLVKRFSEAYLYLINNVNQLLTKEILIKSYFLLSERILEDDIANKVLSVYYENYDEASHYLASLIHFAVLNNVNELNIEFAFMVANLVMLKRKRYPLIPLEFNQTAYREIIESKDISKLTLYFGGIERFSKAKTTDNKQQNVDEIIDRIKEFRSILRNKYHVKKLYLYGSFAKGSNHETSDLDFLVIFLEDILNFERIKIKEKIKNYLFELFNISVDLIDFTNAIENLDINEMENIITII